MRQVASVELLQAMHGDWLDVLPLWALGAGPLLHFTKAVRERSVSDYRRLPLIR